MTNVATCPLCESHTQYEITNFGLHCEGLTCEKCGCNARNRFFYYSLKKILRERENINRRLKVLEASSYGYLNLGEGFLEMMARLGADFTCSDYFERNFKAMIKEDLSNLTFENDSFDMICHSHVLEHVEDDVAAISESYRCLKPGGTLLLSIPIQTDFTFPVHDEYHGDNSFVFRRNGWDIIEKLKSEGFHVEVLVPPEHVALVPSNAVNKDTLVLDNIRFGDKFGLNFFQAKALFYPASNQKDSSEQKFTEIWPHLEIFAARKAVPL